MDHTMVKEFQYRIAHATQADLLLINYEMLIQSINDAMASLDDKDNTSFNQSMTTGQKLLRELTDNLDFKYDISRDLMAIYIFINKQMVNASVLSSKEPLESARGVLGTLLKGWEEAGKKQVGQRPMVGNAQKVYAGLTYGKGTLNETILDNNKSRGYQA